MCHVKDMKENAEEKDELNLITLAQEYSDNDKARELLESMLWPHGAYCPHCKADMPYKLTAKATSKRPARKGLYKCRTCRKQFTVTVGTIFEDSHIPIGKWLMAIYLLCSSKKRDERVATVTDAQTDLQERVVYGASSPLCNGNENTARQIAQRNG